MGHILHTRRSFVVGLLWALSLGNVAAWTSSSQAKKPIRSTRLCATTRRAFFLTSAVTTAVTLFPSVASAKEEPSLSTERQNTDPFDAMSEALRQQGWPNSASPLPIPSTRSLRTSDTNKNNSMNETTKVSSDFEAALQQASKKKQVDPRTHG